MPNRDSISRVLTSWDNQQISPDWIEAITRLEQERFQVERFMERGDHIYGFTSLVGHLDGVAAPTTAETQQEMLDAHLVGPMEDVSGTFLELLTLCRVEQFYQGYTGVHPRTYSELLTVPGKLCGRNYAGSWSSSYGSGDVVSASWLVSTLQKEGILKQWYPGDMICLINGSYVAAAFSMVTIAHVIETAGDSFDLIERVSLWAKTLPRHRGEPVQLPVSLRDMEPIREVLLSTATLLGDALEHRLGNPSGNPLFLSDSAEWNAHSQSSFLDFELPFALLRAQEIIRLLSELEHRSLEFVCGYFEENSEEPNPFLVQPPKVAHATVDSIKARLAQANSYVERDSHGVEDLRDTCFSRAMCVESAIRKMRRLHDLANGWIEALHVGEASAESTRYQLSDLTFGETARTAVEAMFRLYAILRKTNPDPLAPITVRPKHRIVTIEE